MRGGYSVILVILFLGNYKKKNAYIKKSIIYNPLDNFHPWFGSREILYLLISYRPKNVIVSAWVTNKFSFEEADVDDGGIEIYKLENENFECQIVIIGRLCSVHL